MLPVFFFTFIKNFLTFITRKKKKVGWFCYTLFLLRKKERVGGTWMKITFPPRELVEIWFDQLSNEREI